MGPGPRGRTICWTMEPGPSEGGTMHVPGTWGQTARQGPRVYPWAEQWGWTMAISPHRLAIWLHWATQPWYPGMARVTWATQILQTRMAQLCPARVPIPAPTHVPTILPLLSPSLLSPLLPPSFPPLLPPSLPNLVPSHWVSPHGTHQAGMLFFSPTFS